MKINLNLTKPGPKSGHYDWETPEKIDLISGWARNGLSMADIAANMGIRHETLCAYRKRSDKIDNALRVNREVADLRIENALYQSALKGNVIAQKYWLTNRKPSEWREKTEVQHSGMVERPLKGLTIDEIRKILED